MLQSSPTDDIVAEIPQVSTITPDSTTKFNDSPSPSPCSKLGGTTNNIYGADQGGRIWRDKEGLRNNWGSDGACVSEDSSAPIHEALLRENYSTWSRRWCTQRTGSVPVGTDQGGLFDDHSTSHLIPNDLVYNEDWKTRTKKPTVKSHITIPAHTQNAISVTSQRLQLYFPSAQNISPGDITDLVQEAFTATGNELGVEEAKRAGKGFRLPTQDMQRDVQRFIDADGDLPILASTLLQQSA